LNSWKKKRPCEPAPRGHGGLTQSAATNRRTKVGTTGFEADFLSAAGQNRRHCTQAEISDKTLNLNVLAGLCLDGLLVIVLAGR
jgi:hypothetical protein